MNEPQSERTPLHHLHIWQFQAVRDVLILLAIWGLLMLGYYLEPVAVPMLIALGLAYMFEPLVNRLTRVHPLLTRTRVVTLTMAGLVAALALLLTLVVPLVYTQTRDLVRNRGKHAQSLERLAQHPDVPPMLGEYLSSAAQMLQETVDDPDAAVPTEPVQPIAASTQPLTREEVRTVVAEELARQQSAADSQRIAFSSTVRRVATWAGGFALSVVEFVMTIFLVGFFFFVFSTSYPGVMASLRGFVPESRREHVYSLAGKMDQAVSGFVRGRITIVFILAMVFSLGWTICGVPYGLLLGLVVGLATIVPYLAGVGLVAAYVLLLVKLSGAGSASVYHQALADGTLEIVWWRVALFPALVFIIAQILDDYVLTPMIQGPATNLSTPAIVVAVIAGGSLAGLYGMLLAIPTAACLRILAADVFWPKFKLWVQGKRADPLPLGR